MKNRLKKALWFLVLCPAWLIWMFASMIVLFPYWIITGNGMNELHEPLERFMGDKLLDD